MSADADKQRITLTETQEGEWLAELAPAGVTGSGETAQEALLSAREHAREARREGLRANHNEDTEAALEALDRSAEAAGDLLEARDNVAMGLEEGDTSYRSTTPLYDLVGMLDEVESGRLRERSREFRDQFDRRVGRTRHELSKKR